MRRWWQIFVLCVFWMLLLWLTTPCLNLKTDSAPQEKWMDGAPRHCSCPWFKFWQCSCPSGSLNHSICHRTAGERWLDAGYEKSLMGATEFTLPGAVLWWSDLNATSELGRMWKKLLKVIPQPSMSHFDLFCGTCALMGNSKILRAAGHSNNVNRPSMVSRFLKVVQFPSRMEDRKDQDSRFGSGSEKQRRWSPYWEDVNQTNRDSVHVQQEAEMEVS